jgi:hypothetical protein
MKQSTPFALLGLLFAGISFADVQVVKTPAEQAVSPTVQEQDCFQFVTTLRAEVTAQPSMVLELVEKALRLSPTCSCEIVKAAIEGTNADIKLVASIVEVVALTEPEQLRISSQCAIAMAPDAVDAVYAVLAKYDPATGESGLDSGKSAKDAKSGKEGTGKEVVEEKLPNPLDFPGSGNENAVNLSPNSPGGTGSWGIGIAGNPTAVAAGTGGGSNNPAATGNAPL